MSGMFERNADPQTFRGPGLRGYPESDHNRSPVPFRQNPPSFVRIRQVQPETRGCCQVSLEGPGYVWSRVTVRTTLLRIPGFSTLPTHLLALGQEWVGCAVLHVKVAACLCPIPFLPFGYEGHSHCEGQEHHS